MSIRVGRNAAIATVFGAMLATGVATGFSGQAQAAEPQGFYVRGDVGGSFTRDLDGSVLDGDGFSGDFGNSWAFDVGVGYQLPYNLRVELAGGYRPGYEIRSREATGGIPLAADADARTWTVMANAYYDIATGTKLTPYVGAGLGVAFNRLDTISYRLGGSEIREEGKNKTNFAWAVMAGVAYSATSNIKLDFGYRYLDAGDFETSGSTNVGPATKIEGDVRAHEVKIGLRYQF